MSYGKVKSLTFPFGCKVYIHNNGKDNLGKFDEKSDIGTFLGYSSTSKAYRVYNHRTKVVEESIHVRFDDTLSPPRKVVGFDDVGNEDEIQKMQEEVKSMEIKNESFEKREDGDPSTTTSWARVKDHPMEQIIGKVDDRVKTRR